MLAGFLVLKLGGALPIDVIGNLVLNVIAVLLVIRLAQRVQSMSPGSSLTSAESRSDTPESD
jgi:hypothetical protein